MTGKPIVDKGLVASFLQFDIIKSKEDYNMSLGENIKNERQKLKLSQEYIAEKLGVSRQAVSKWERNQSEPTTKNLIELADLFQISLSELTHTKETTSKTIPITNQHIKCSYCGQKAQYFLDQTQSKAYCSLKCQLSHDMALEKIQKQLKWFYLGIALSVILLFVSAFPNLPFQKNYLTGAGMLCLGMAMILFPFCTPETYQKLGYLKSKKLARVLGYLIEIYALFILFFG